MKPDITTKLPTGIVTTQKDRGGIITITADNYDIYFDQPLLETDVKQDLFETFNRMFKPQMQY